MQKNFGQFTENLKLTDIVSEEAHRLELLDKDVKSSMSKC